MTHNSTQAIAWGALGMMQGRDLARKANTIIYRAANVQSRIDLLHCSRFSGYWMLVALAGLSPIPQMAQERLLRQLQYRYRRTILVLPVR